MLTAARISELQRRIARDDRRLPMLLGVLGDARRFHILRILGEQCDACVGDMAKIFGISSSAVSQQLRILETAGFVEKERKGKTLCYKLRAADPLVRSVMRFLALPERKGRKRKDI